MKKSIIQESQGVSYLIIAMTEEIKNIIKNHGTTYNRDAGKVLSFRSANGGYKISLENFYFIHRLDLTFNKKNQSEGGTSAHGVDNLKIENGRIVCMVSGTEKPYTITSSIVEHETENGTLLRLNGTLSHELNHIYRFYVKLKNSKNLDKTKDKIRKNDEMYFLFQKGMRNPNKLIKNFSFFKYIIDNDEIECQKVGTYNDIRKDNTVSNSQINSYIYNLSNFLKYAESIKDNIQEWVILYHFLHQNDITKINKSKEASFKGNIEMALKLRDSYIKNLRKYISLYLKQLKKISRKAFIDAAKNVDFDYERTWDEYIPKVEKEIDPFEASEDSQDTPVEERVEQCLNGNQKAKYALLLKQISTMKRFSPDVVQILRDRLIKQLKDNGEYDELYH